MFQAYDLTAISENDIDFTSEFVLTAHPIAPPPASTSSPAANTTAAPPHEKEGALSSYTSTTTATPSVPCCGLVLWFDVSFTERFCSAHPVTLSTSPFATPTHWSQTLLTFQETIHLAAPDASSQSAPTGTHGSGPGSGSSSAGSSAVGNDAGGDSGVAAAPTAAAGASLGGSDPPVGSPLRPVTALHGRISVARSDRYREMDVSVEVWGRAADGVLKRWPPQLVAL